MTNGFPPPAKISISRISSRPTNFCRIRTIFFLFTIPLCWIWGNGDELIAYVASYSLQHGTKEGEGGGRRGVKVRVGGEERNILTKFSFSALASLVTAKWI